MGIGPFGAIVHNKLPQVEFYEENVSKFLTPVLLLFATFYLPQMIFANSLECRSIHSISWTVRSQTEISPKSKDGFYLYRALTGKGKILGGQWLFEGVNDSSINSNGIFNSNQSHAQYRSEPGQTGIDLRVAGLPVFFNLSEALYWIKGKTFLKPPAVVRVWINLESVASDIKQIAIFRNHFDGKVIEQTKEVLEQHILGTTVIRGEAYIRSTDYNFENLRRVIRPFEEVMRPSEQDYTLYSGQE